MTTRRPALTLSFAALFFALPLAAQDPGSMASKITKPSVCGDTQILKFNASTGLFECQDEGAGGGQGDNISVNATAAADANFIDSATIGFSLNGVPTPDEIAAAILADALDPSHIDETADFAFTGSLFAAGALTCGAGTAGRARVHTTPWQYCDNAATPALRYAAYGDAAGKALSGDSATAFFSSGLLEPSVGGTGAAPAADDQLLVSDSASAATWRAVPACANSATDKLLYDAATNAFSCAADQNTGGSPAWENLINGSDTATAYTSNNFAETVTFNYNAAYGAGFLFGLDASDSGTNNLTAASFDIEGTHTAGTQAQVNALSTIARHNGTGGTVTDLVGIRVQANSEAAGTVTNNYGLLVADQDDSGATENWNIYSGTTISSFNSAVQFALDNAANAFGFRLPSADKIQTVGVVIEDTGSTNNLNGVYSAVSSANATGTRANTTAVEGDVYQVAAGTLTSATGVGGYIQADAGVITNAIAFRAFSPFENGGAISTTIGLLVDSQTGVSPDASTWAIRTDGGRTEHRAGTATTIPLVARGAAAQSANLQEWQDSTASTLASVTSDGAFDTTAGYRLNGAATTGRYLRGNGTNFVQSSGAASGTGSCTNQFVRALNDDAAPTCASVTRDDVTDSLRTAQITYTFFDPANDLPATLNVPSVYANRARAITLTEVYCEIDAGSASINLQRDDGSPADILSSDLACSTAGATSTGFVAGENALALNHNLDHVTVSAGAGLRRLNLAIKYTID